MKKFALLFALGIVAITGCQKSKKNNGNTPTITNVNDIKVPSGFNWESSQNVTVSAAITDTRFGTARHMISVYDGDPYNGGSLLAQGSASTAAAYAATLYLPKTLKDLYIVKTSPDNAKIVTSASLASSTAVSVSFGEKDPTAFPTVRLANHKITADCSSGCTSTITTSTSNLNVNSGDVICVTGNNITVNFSNINGGTIRVCGSNVTLQNCNLNGSSVLLITSSGSATASSLNFNSSSATLQNDGTLTIGGSTSDNGIFTNNGTFTCSGDFNINSNAGAFANYGTMNVSGNFNNNGPVSGLNEGSIIITGAFQQNSGAGAFVNKCSLRANGHYNQNSAVKNYGFIKVGGTLTINSSTELGVYNSSMISTNGFTSNSKVVGYGATSFLKITGGLTLNSGGGVSGAVQVSSTNTFNASFLFSGAALGNSVYIATTGCNSEGNGTPAVTDTDGDGVPDNTDAYPSDPTKAYNNYYPSSTGSATVAFEDQWPSKGDYDMNDLVMGYQYKVVTNAANNVVQVTGNYSLYATGGEFGNGFAVEFPVTTDKVSGVTGGYLVTGQTNATIELFSNMRGQMTEWNTKPGAATSPAKAFTVTFNVSSGPSLSTFGLNCYNPFIWHNAGKEVHLPGKRPTSLADNSLFGTSDDNTNVGANRFYVTGTGLPYALDVPVMPFRYPVEDTDITRAYLHFADWAQSGGATFTDWYSNTASGYRNTSFIFNN